MSEFEEASQPSEFDATRATARLPGLDIEIIHRRAPAGDAEQISINLQAAPSFEAFGRFLGTANPFAFWMAAAQLAWSPWLEAARIILPASAARSLPSARGRSSDRDAPRQQNAPASPPDGEPEGASTRFRSFRG